jgi:hypothetical protein
MGSTRKVHKSSLAIEYDNEPEATRKTSEDFRSPSPLFLPLFPPLFTPLLFNPTPEPQA